MQQGDYQVLESFLQEDSISDMARLRLAVRHLWEEQKISELVTEFAYDFYCRTCGSRDRHDLAHCQKCREHDRTRMKNRAREMLGL